MDPVTGAAAAGRIVSDADEGAGIAVDTGTGVEVGASLDPVTDRESAALPGSGANGGTAARPGAPLGTSSGLSAKPETVASPALSEGGPRVGYVEVGPCERLAGSEPVPPVDPELIGSFLCCGSALGADTVSSTWAFVGELGAARGGTEG